MKDEKKKKKKKKMESIILFAHFFQDISYVKLKLK